MRFLFVVSLLLTISVDDFFETCLGAESPSFVSILGDPGMTNPDARFALEGWNACNEVGEETEGMGSPRMADCADLKCPIHDNNSASCNVTQKVSNDVNRLKAGDAFPPGSNISVNPWKDVNKYGAEKERYLGSLCQKNEDDDTDKEAWYFWMIMLKNGNLDMNNATVNCPRYGKEVNTTEVMTWDKPFPCFGSGCMNQPLVFRTESRLDDESWFASLTGGFYGTYDLLDSGLTINNSAPASNKSYFSVTWQKEDLSSSWSISFKLTTSPNYPWLTMYLRADAATGPNAGYPYDGRGIIMITKPLKSPNFKVRMSLHIIQGGGEISQFSLTNIGGCWKNNGSACDGDVTTDVTRSVQMIINPTISRTCSSNNLKACPLYHTNTTTGEIIYKNQTDKFPYEAYHLYCAPGNAMLNDTEIDKCDPFTNPMQQELVQIAPHPEWAKLGYPATTEDVGWELGDPKYWDLHAGNLTDNMYFYQDQGYTKAATRIWRSIMVGTEMYNLKPEDRQFTAQWTVSDFDVLVSK